VEIVQRRVVEVAGLAGTQQKNKEKPQSETQRSYK